MLIVQFLIPGTVPFQCSSNSPLSALRFHHFLSLIFISSWNEYIRRAHFFQRYWQGAAPIVVRAFSFGRHAFLDPRRGKRRLRSPSFPFFIAREGARAENGNRWLLPATPGPSPGALQPLAHVPV